MDKLTQFFRELLTNTDKLDHFNSGENESEIASNRRSMLNAAGVKHAEEIIRMTPQDLQKLMEKQLAQKTSNDVETTICGLIAKQMLEYPERIAIIDGETRIDYKSLMKRASEVAGELKSRGVESESLVGVCMNRSWELVATLIGVMQAGCAYVPLDPAYPQDRVRYMLEHSRAVAAFVDNDSTAYLCSGVRELLWINKIGDHTDSVVRPSANDLAYVIYTSGSTGRPKGVAVEHRSVVAMRQSMRDKFSDEELKGMFAGASVCFDTSVMEIMGTLSLGGTIILAKNALELTKLPAVDQVRTCVMVASAVQALLSTERLPEGIRCLVFGGEALKRSLVEQVYALRPDLRVLNAYGPTEDTVYSTIAEVSRGTKVITIGKSVPNSRTYILDDALQPVSDGVAGELYLAGNKLARGYLYDKTLTKERFIEKEPNDLIPDNRLYKTGDLCRWTNNAEIEFLGRVDQQVKIRGFRIELEEIESTLESMQGVDAVAATAADGGIGQKILVVYVVSRDETVTETKVKSYLSQRLPKYMVPQVVKHLNALPLLPNDKLDRKKLINLEKEVNFESDAIAISTNTEAINSSNILIQRLVGSKDEQQATILSIIQNEVASLLNLKNPAQVLPDHSFDGLGLDSLTTLEFSCRLTKLLGQELSANVIFEYSTPNALVNYITNMIGSSPNSCSTDKLSSVTTDTLASFQTNIQSSHPTFQAANAPSWNATDKSKLVQELMHMVNDNRRNPYGKVLQTGSAARGIVSDSYNDEKQEAIIWSTNLYFGLNRDPKVIEEASIALTRFGTGMGISAAATGMTNQHLEFEKEFADLVGKPSACLFPTGYTANLGAISGLLGKNDVVVIDQLCHASIVDGARLSGAAIRTFKHNNASDLAAVLESEVSPYRTVLVVLESVYSMGEGTAPVAEIVRTAKKYNALVLVDEAHSFGFYGKDGAGICAAQGVTDEVDFIMTTLSKALGSIGGVIAASQEHIGLLKSSSRAYIFQASISPADIAAALTSLRRLRSDDSLREQLWDMTRYMRQRFEEAGYDLGTGDGPIVTPHFGDKDKLYAIVQSLYQRGVQTLAVTYPIVEIGRGRLRLICSASHTREDVDKTLEALIEAEREVDEQLDIIRYETRSSNITHSDVEVWAKVFSSYLKKSIAEVAAPTPNLAISVSVSEQSEPVTILCKDGDVTLSAHKNCDLPSCSLLLTEKAAVSALQSSDIQGLLHSICKGTCVLKGQVEPFIWFIGRIVDQRQGIYTDS
ncbi:amino acid adenylation domain-containing protein [Aquimarina sp. MAR_2010_214]|uniref:amino acid adenylation domain-containing protein n=1 Tax=Aquimarina sp. MAR_2010_214 TaxID=1250026 RepID=UPI000C70CAB1|nr:amino acid adenylation domain-containing protein [Aquimarina sp. MAR_2010_214]PKV50904.1 amino acid adenylation domain-containing protein [Aquimarina sp. MAR_2010_214]